MSDVSGDKTRQLERLLRERRNNGLSAWGVKAWEEQVDALLGHPCDWPEGWNAPPSSCPPAGVEVWAVYDHNGKLHAVELKEDRAHWRRDLMGFGDKVKIKSMRLAVPECADSKEPK